ncbi:hypothetical protein JMJ77_0015077, partial [Colletotrichum scovillei]
QSRIPSLHNDLDRRGVRPPSTKYSTPPVLHQVFFHTLWHPNIISCWTITIRQSVLSGCLRNCYLLSQRIGTVRSICHAS